jgi:hypothetical protein
LIPVSTFYSGGIQRKVGPGDRDFIGDIQVDFRDPKAQRDWNRQGPKPFLLPTILLYALGKNHTTQGMGVGKYKSKLIAASTRHNVGTS